MQFAVDEIVQLTVDIFATVLHFEASECNRCLADDDARLTACVQIAGAWKGAVLIDAPCQLGRQAAGVMFNVPLDQVTTADTHDALAELVNMVGGNLKTLLPGPSFLSLPAVTDGNDFSLTVPGSRLVTRVELECRDQMMAVMLLEEEPLASRVAGASCAV